MIILVAPSLLWVMIMNEYYEVYNVFQLKDFRMSYGEKYEWFKFSITVKSDEIVLQGGSRREKTDACLYGAMTIKVKNLNPESLPEIMEFIKNIPLEVQKQVSAMIYNVIPIAEIIQK